MIISLEDELKARKLVNLRKRALKGEIFKGSSEYRKKEHRRVKSAGDANADRIKYTALGWVKVNGVWEDPDKEFIKEHLGLRPEEYHKFHERVLSGTLGPEGAEYYTEGDTPLDVLHKLPRNKDGTVMKQYITSGSWDAYPEGVLEKHRKLARSKGLMTKKPDAKNLAPVTLKNPFGGGRPEKQADLSLPDDKQVNKTAVNVLANIDLHKLPGMYDTAYTPETKLQAVVAWITTGSVAAAADYASVSKNTILRWKKQAPWWLPLADAIQAVRAEELDANLSNMITDSMQELADRVKNGDYKYNAKLDKAVQVPMTARDLSSVIDRMISNRNLLRGDPTSRTESRTVEENLNYLRGEFKRMGAEAEDADITEVLNEPSES